MITEKITHEPKDKGAWICICGNRPAYGGFYPCDVKGNEIEPTTGSGWKNLYVCDDCGRIINMDTLDVVGRKKLSPLEHIIKSVQERDKFFTKWEKRQKKPIKYGSAGEHIGDKETLGMAGLEISIYKK